MAKIIIPKIVTCGMQSYCKSSILSNTKNEFQSKAEKSTISTIKIYLRELSKGKEYYTIKYENGDKKDDNNKDFKNLKQN